MMRSKSISGVNMLKIADYKPHVLAQCLQEVYTIVTSEKLTPIVGATFTADNIIEAHSLLESGSSSGKICVKW